MKKINIFFIHFLIFANMCKMVLFVSFKIPFYFADYIIVGTTWYRGCFIADDIVSIFGFLDSYEFTPY